MQIQFSKYQGTGNDFIIIDNREMGFNPNPLLIRNLCNRNFGIGADGLMLLSNSNGFDFSMQYFNSDGNESTMCGNGGRCITLFAKKIGLINSDARFKGIDGEHISTVVSDNVVRLKMIDINNIEAGDDYYFLDTGSPHYVCFVDDVSKIDVATEGRMIRNTYNINKGGTNVNFVQSKGNKLVIRTFERGVEGETLACGTGSVAAAIAFNHYFETPESDYCIVTRGGELKVSFKRINDLRWENIYLEGPAHHVFDGHINIPGNLS